MVEKNLMYQDLVKDNNEEFSKGVHKLASELNINPNWLMGVFYIETAAAVTGVIDHRARNKSTNATGLIQFMPSTAKSLGTTVDELQQMTNIEQLDYVKKYLSPYKGRIKRFVDCYLAVFFPAAIGKSPEWVLQSGNLSAATVARYNPLYDINKDGKITVGEIESKLKQFIAPGYDV